MRHSRLLIGSLLIACLFLFILNLRISSPLNDIWLADSSTKGVVLLNGLGGDAWFPMDPESNPISATANPNGELLVTFNLSGTPTRAVNQKTRESRMIDLKGSFVGGARWSPNGEKFAFAREGYTDPSFVRVFDNTKIELLMEKLLPATFFLKGIAWINNDTLILLVNDNPDKDVESLYSLTADGKVLQKLCSGPIDLAFQHGVAAEGTVKPVPCLDTPGFEALFGSKEWPTDRLIPSTDTSGRYYFYQRTQENLILGTKYWIEGYDRLKHKTFTVKNFGRPY